jgi:hypothetical protein
MKARVYEERDIGNISFEEIMEIGIEQDKNLKLKEHHNYCVDVFDENGYAKGLIIYLPYLEIKDL